MMRGDDDGMRNLLLRGGCAAKLPGASLRRLLAQLGDEAAVWQDAALLEQGSGPLLTTVDFAPLACADPNTAGRIAALNAFSDIYASGGVPLIALAMIIVDTARPLSVAEEVLAGMAAASAEEGARVAGGQTVTGSECMAGLCVIGRPREGIVFRKRGALAGDHLLLSKPLGTGLATWAHAIGAAGDDTLAAAIAVMLTSNREASRAAVDARAHAVTDVTGFGLLGHLGEMLHQSLGAVIDYERVPILGGIRDLPEAARSTSAVGANLRYVRETIALRTTRSDAELAPLLDGQTNGGLLVAASPGSAARLERQGFMSIGSVTDSAAIVVQ